MRKMSIGWSKNGVILKEVAARPAPAAAVVVKAEATVTAMVIDAMMLALTLKSLL